MSHTSKLEPIWFAPQRKGTAGWICFKDAPSAPPAPDYVGAAQATATGNLTAAQQSQRANMVNQNTPYGSLTYSRPTPSKYSPDDPRYMGPEDPGAQWQSDISLTPTGQQLLDYSNKSALGVGALQDTATQNVAGTMAKPFDTSSVSDIANKAYAGYTSRLDPQWQARAEQQKAELANQGLVPGGEAYDNAMRDFNNARNDAYTQANTASIETMPQTYQLAAALRSQPLNELNALRTGSQVTNPTFGPSPQQQPTSGPNYLGAAQAQGQYGQGLYNAGVGQANSFNSGLMGLGGALGAAYMMAPVAAVSDRRLKSNIVRIGEHPLGIGIYEYDIFGQRDVGVMAQEVLEVQPEAVLLHPSGFLMVDYGRLHA